MIQLFATAMPGGPKDSSGPGVHASRRAQRRCDA
ncbi:hypothetical protein SAMN05216577_13660 [Pseudomonas citronellolis]|uniref:Uncharacterized protein n=1 Tax=Pseudomonas citronellolis TaxID=53408 RepID=A0AAQ1R0A4_9PSED|nr:hypothetical protein [Pseudomonas citronellolis]MCP1645751.1 hypothetical protein [Pseudomonas citronellolis]MCP1653920.1 hypothetical protein [Pseudomonas citronellolis]MCP1668585.1 hypothetical protein [Pseudomonas citronellolis]MCP1700023.1 hypothetical protein [Pseudomonas citronellolis]